MKWKIALQQILSSIDLSFPTGLIPRALARIIWCFHSAQWLDLFAWCVSLSRLLASFQTLFKAITLSFHTVLKLSQIVVWILDSVLEPPLGGLGSMYTIHLRLIGKRVVDFLVVLIVLWNLKTSFFTTHFYSTATYILSRTICQISRIRTIDQIIAFDRGCCSITNSFSETWDYHRKS